MLCHCVPDIDFDEVGPLARNQAAVLPQLSSQASTTWFCDALGKAL